MNLTLNDSLIQFKELADKHQYQDEDRVVLKDAGPDRGEESVRRLKRRDIREDGTTQFDENNIVRTALLNSLKNQFDGTIPASVKKALAGTSRWGASDMDTADGQVTTGRPLTMRRIRRILVAVTGEMQKQRTDMSIALADGQLELDSARALVKDQLRLMTERWPAENRVLSAEHLASLRTQIDTTDLKTLARLYEGFTNNNPDPAPADRVEHTPELRARIDNLLATAQNRERTADAAQDVVPPESRESFVKFLGRSDVRRQLVEHLSQLDDAPMYWANNEQWDDAFAVNQLVSLWQNEQQAVAGEQKILTDRLESGLVQKDATVATNEAVNEIMHVLAGQLNGLAVLEDATVVDRMNEMQTALASCVEARERLAEVQARNLASNTNGARGILAAAVEAETALAEKIMSFVNAVRAKLKVVALPPVQDDIIDTSDPSKKLDPVKDTLEKLDDLVTSTQFNAVRLENVGADIVNLGAHADQVTLDKLASDLATLVAGTAPTDQEREAAKTAIQKCVNIMTPLMEKIAKLETLPPDAETAELAGELSQSLQDAFHAIEGLDSLKGVDPDAKEDLILNLTNAHNALRICGRLLRENLLANMSNELVTMLFDCHSQLSRHADKSTSEASEVRRQLLTLEGKLRGWKDNLNNATLAERLVIFEEIVNNLSAWTEENAALAPMRKVLISRSGMNRFIRRNADRKALANDTSPDEPFSRIDAKLLGMALRGEINVGQFVQLREAHYPEEMFRADLVEKRGARGWSVGTGAFNKVVALDMYNVRTGATERVVLKDVELSGEAAPFSIAGRFSSSNQVQATDKINYATSKAATLIGCGQQITKCGMVRVGNRFRLAQEFVQGDTLEKVIKNNAKVFEMPDPQNPTRTKVVSFSQGCEALERLNPKALERLKQELQIAAAKLEWADLLTGQLDRHLSNVMLKIRVTGTTPKNMHVEVHLKGIDNDAGFTEGHISVTKFKRNSKDQRVYDVENPNDLKSLLKNEGVRNFRMPAFLPLSVKRRLDAMDEDTFRREMGPLLGKKALDSAVNRLMDLKNYARALVREGLLINDLDPEEVPSADELEMIVKTNEDLWAPDLPKAMESNTGNLYNRLFK